MPRKRPPNSESTKPVLTLRVKPETLDHLDDLAEKSGRTRADVAGELLVDALGHADVQHFTVEERAVRKAAAEVRVRLLRAVSNELELMEDE